MKLKIHFKEEHEEPIWTLEKELDHEHDALNTQIDKAIRNFTETEDIFSDLAEPEYKGYIVVIELVA